MEDVGNGVPSLLDGWLAVLDAADQTRLSPLSATGEIAAPLATEPDIGSGEPLAAIHGPCSLRAPRDAPSSSPYCTVSRRRPHPRLNVSGARSAGQRRGRRAGDR